jgi:hypothetical protein
VLFICRLTGTQEEAFSERNTGSSCAKLKEKEMFVLDVRVLVFFLVPCMFCVSVCTLKKLLEFVSFFFKRCIESLGVIFAGIKISLLLY